MIKRILLALLVILIVIQFFHPEKNESAATAYDISKSYQIPTEVEHLLKVSCMDCHSNSTVYPWYSKIQPIAWWLDGHIRDGKRHLNYSEFTKLPLAIQYHKFEETVEMVEEEEMPIPSYTYFGLHPEADLTEKEREQITDWAKNQMDFLEANYPADSLVMPRRR